MNCVDTRLPASYFDERFNPLSQTFPFRSGTMKDLSSFTSVIPSKQEGLFTARTAKEGIPLPNMRIIGGFIGTKCRGDQKFVPPQANVSSYISREFELLKIDSNLLEPRNGVFRPVSEPVYDKKPQEMNTSRKKSETFKMESACNPSPTAVSRSGDSMLTYASVAKGEVRPPEQIRTPSRNSSTTSVKRRRRKRKGKKAKNEQKHERNPKDGSQAKETQKTDMKSSGCNRKTVNSENSVSKDSEVEGSLNSVKDKSILQVQRQDGIQGCASSQASTESSEAQPKSRSTKKDDDDDVLDHRHLWCTNSSIAFILAGNEDISDFESDWDEVDGEVSSDFSLDLLLFPYSECILSMSVITGDRLSRNDCHQDSINSVDQRTSSEEQTDSAVVKENVLDVVNRKWNELYLNSVCGDADAKVHFAGDDELVETFPADDVERSGPWEQMAADRMRFQRQIRSFEPTLSPVLEAEHRKKVYERFHESQC